MIIGPGWNSSGYEIIYVNDAFSAMTGYSPDEVAGRSMSILQCANTDPSVLNQQRKRMNKGLSFHGETVARRKDRSEEHTSELQSRGHLVCRLLLEKKKNERTY